METTEYTQRLEPGQEQEQEHEQERAHSVRAHLQHFQSQRSYRAHAPASVAKSLLSQLDMELCHCTKISFFVSSVVTSRPHRMSRIILFLMMTLKLMQNNIIFSQSIGAQGHHANLRA